MFYQSEFNKISEEYSLRTKTRTKKSVKIWKIIMVVYIVVIAILVFIFRDILNKSPGNIFLFVYGGIGYFGILLGIIISSKYISEKPTFEYLYDEVYQKINSDEGIFLEYLPYEKKKHVFNKIGGLYIRFASVSVRRHVSGHFDGIYFIVKTNTNNYFQARTNSSPKLKGQKYTRVKEIEDFKVYTEEGKSLLNNDHQVINYLRQIKADNNLKHVAISFVPGEIHCEIRCSI